MADANETAPPDAAQAEPGAPIPEDAIDSELLRLPPPRPPRSPMVAVAVVLLGCLLLYRLHVDLLYALQPSTPVELGDARAAALRPETFVSVRGMPDHRNTLAFEAKGDRTRSQLFRLLGTRSRVLVVTVDPAARPGLDNRFVGRARAFDSLPYAASIRDFYDHKARTLRALDLAALGALPPGPLPVPFTAPDRSGEPLALGAGDELLLSVRFPADVRVLAQKTKVPSEPDARHEVERLGAPVGPAVETRDGYGYVLRVSEGPAREALIARLEERGLLFRQRIETYRVPLGQVRIGPEGLTLPGPAALPQPVVYEQAGDRLQPAPGAATTVLPLSQILSVQVSEPVTVAKDAMVILEGESPTAWRWTLPVAVLLLLFIAFNLWYLWRGLSKRQEASA